MTTKGFIGLDMTDVSVLAVDLMAQAATALPATKKIIEVGANKVKKEAAATIRAADTKGRLPAYPSSITYDVEVEGTGNVSGEIGPDKDRTQGPLGNVLEYGTSRSGPVPHLQPALEGEATIVEAELAIIAAKVVARRRP